MHRERHNICLLTDSYKASHYLQYPPGTESVYSYFESRTGGRFSETVFFGLQYFLESYLAGEVLTLEMIDEADSLFRNHFGGQDIFNRRGWLQILESHRGRLPVRIRAVPEGTVVPESNVMMTVENTDPNAFWLTNYLETLLVQTWYGSTVATQSRAMKQLIHKSLEATGDPELLPFKLHDFGFRGVTCPEQAAIGGAAHLVNFQGTDTVAGISMARQVYSADMPGYSIPAAEHSTIASWGESHEMDAMRNMLVQYPTGLVACVSDSFDIYRACAEYWGDTLRDEVIARDGVLVVRPDSGDPPVVINRVLALLGEAFGTELNAKGYRLLHPKIRIIQGDGIDYTMLEHILDSVQAAGWSADNLAFGSGGGLLQKLNRDTQRFAFKCSSVTVDGQTRDVYKSPVTSQGKASKRGRLKLVRQGNSFVTVGVDAAGENCLQTVFENGMIQRRHNFAEIRDRAAI